MIKVLRIGGSLLVENRDTTQFAAVPFGLVLGELRVDRLEEWAHERDLVARTDNVSLVIVVFD